ncbi:hypothetical protein D3C75_732220 [compost metagenome]
MNNQRYGFVQGFNFRQVGSKNIRIPVCIALPALVQKARFFPKTVKMRIRLHIILSVAGSARIPARHILLHNDFAVHILYPEQEGRFLNNQPYDTSRKNQLLIRLLHREQMGNAAFCQDCLGCCQIRHLTLEYLHPEHIITQKYKHHPPAFPADNVDILRTFPGHYSSRGIPCLRHNQRTHFLRAYCLTALHLRFPPPAMILLVLNTYYPDLPDCYPLTL